VGLFSSSGQLLPSNWASVNLSAGLGVGLVGGVDCVADGLGNVYAFSGTTGLTRYDLLGNVLQAFQATGGSQLSMDLAPDECTMDLSVWQSGPAFGGPFNVCTNTNEGTFDWQLIDDMRVLPNWQILQLGDHAARLLDASGQGIRSYGPPPGDTGYFRFLSLDPDGTSFWACCDPYMYRFDIATGQILTQWPSGAGGGSFAVYGPPLLGDANVESDTVSNGAGTAEAFRTRVGYSGPLTRVHLYIDSSATASNAVVGIYSDRSGHPGTLVGQGTIAGVRSGSWNYVDIPSLPVTAGQYYWLAVLDPHGAGTLALRHSGALALGMVSAQHNLTALPAHWSGGSLTPSGSVSAYGS
jgi:hypothetical protein